MQNKFIRKINKFIRKINKIFRTAFPLPPLLLSYLKWRLFADKSNSKLKHKYSQLLSFSPRLRKLPGMTTITERAYFQWYAQHIYTGTGEIVDLGCWLGSTTISLAMGLEKNKIQIFSNGKIHAYDEFVCRPYMLSGLKGTPFEGKLQVGESFVELFRTQIAPWQEHIIVHPGDLAHMKWEGGMIEFLLIDAMKSWDLTNNILKSFFPALKPGVSYILHQDFAHWFTPWIHLMNFRLRDYFQCVYEVPRSGSVLFKLVHTIPNELMAQPLSFAKFSKEEIDAAFKHSMSLVASEKHPDVAAAKVMLYFHIGDFETAKFELEVYRKAGLSFNSDLSTVEKRLLGQQKTLCQ